MFVELQGVVDRVCLNLLPICDGTWVTVARALRFYEGVIDGFHPGKKKHKVSYTDGDEEILNLRNERWELVSGNSKLDREQATECQSPDPSFDMEWLIESVLVSCLLVRAVGLLL
ncbi:hypothetical protein LOK49_LG15G02153 [Camellia lanceoleosa]|uniref:Uncharacterized protein n=1 Tax=Camellia lanceoleosa TaxID=1840588 RepID=A0ACC0F7G4_9ERIC|nr:hypothetical protein LOK49_LG15G02153 [Camellia lanceoleosa]